MLYVAFILACGVLAAVAGWWLGMALGYPFAWLVSGVVGWVIGSAGVRVWAWSQR